MAEEGVIRLLMTDPSLLSKADIAEEDFTSPFLKKLFGIIKGRIASGESVDQSVISALITNDEASQLGRILSRPESAAVGQRAIKDYIEKIRAENKKPVTDDDELLRASQKYKEKKGYGG